MFRWLKKHFIPHAGNGHRPHFLQTKNTAKLVVAICLVELILFVLPTLNFSRYANNLNLSAVLPGVLSNLTNEERMKTNLPILKENPLLVHAAELKAADMASKSYFAHTSPEGKTPWYWFNEAGYSFEYAGENLAVNFTDSEKVTEAWMNSPAHRANIIAGNYSEVGTGIASGTYKGRDSIFVAQVYGRPKIKNQLVSNVSSSEWEQLMASPLATTDAALGIFFGVVLGALLLSILLKGEQRHADIIRNALCVIAIIIIAHLFNSHIAAQNFETSFMAFDESGAVN